MNTSTAAIQTGQFCNASEIFFARIDRNFHITEANSHFWSVCSNNTVCKTGTHLFKNTLFNTIEQFEALCKQCLQQPGSTQNIQLQISDSQQQKRWLCIELEPVVKQQLVTGLNIFGRDMTDQKNKEAERQFQVRLFDQVSEAVITTDILFNILSWNKAAEDIYHFTKEEMIGRNAFNVFQYNYSNSSTEEAAHALMEHDCWQGEVDFIRHDDAEKMFLHASVTTMRDEQNAILGYVAVNRNITANKIQEQQRFNQVQQLLDAWAQTSSEGLFIIDAEYNLHYVNNAAVHIAELAICRQIKPGDNLMQLAHPKRKKDMQKALQQVFLGNTIRYEAMYDFFADQKIHWFAHCITPIADESGKVLFACAVSTDITNEKLLQQELLFRKEQERKEILTEIIAAQEKERHRIAYELHENIAQLLALSKLYLKPDVGNAQQTTATQIVTMAIDELRKLSYALDPENLKRTGLVETVGSLVDNFNKTHPINIKLFAVSYTALYPCDHEIELAIFRIIQDKLDNILKYSNAANAEITLSKSQTEVVLCISDDGIGFNINAKEQGLGIKNMYNRSELYNGSLLINTGPCKGCILTLVIPTHTPTHKNR